MSSKDTTDRQLKLKSPGARTKVTTLIRRLYEEKSFHFITGSGRKPLKLNWIISECPMKQKSSKRIKIQHFIGKEEEYMEDY